MDDEQLHAIAAESEETRANRAALQQKLAVLQSGKQILHEHSGTSHMAHLDLSSQTDDTLTAMRPTARAPAQSQTKFTRPRTPGARTRINTTPSTKGQSGVNDLAAHLQAASLTPPQSAPSSRVSSRSRHDSLNGSPPRSGSAKKTEARRSLAKRVGVPPAMDMETDGEL